MDVVCEVEGGRLNGGREAYCAQELYRLAGAALQSY